MSDSSDLNALIYIINGAMWRFLDLEIQEHMNDLTGRHSNDSFLSSALFWTTYNERCFEFQKHNYLNSMM